MSLSSDFIKNSGAFAIGEILTGDTVVTTIKKYTRYTSCTSTGSLSTNSSQAYGRWNCDIHKGGSGNIFNWIIIGTVRGNITNSSQNGYYLNFDAVNNINFCKVTNGVSTTLITDNITRNFNSWYNIIIDRSINGIFNLYVNNVCIASVTDDTFNNSLYTTFDLTTGDRFTNIKLFDGIKLDGNFENQWYGVSYNITNSSPTLTRIGGTMSYHASLPAQNLLQACLLNDNLSVNYYLNPNDWGKRADGTNSNLDGTDGQVMIRKTAPLYWKFESNGNIRNIKVSLYPIQGFSQTPVWNISAYEASLNRTNSKLSSVVNSTTSYRGGDNSNWDGLSKSLLGKPATSISSTNFRTYARNRGTGWNQQIYSSYLEIYWLFVIEYATFNSQLAVNNSLDANGYRQGGLGDGVTTANGTEWSNFNGNNPFINCGASNSLGSGTGEVSVNVIDFGGSGITRTATVNRYRGIENPFGHIWKWVDGVNIYNTNNVTQSLYIIDNPNNLADATSSNARFAGLISNTEGYQKGLLMGSYGDILPISVGGSSSTYMCDYYYPSTSSNAWTALCVGGTASYGTNAGLLHARVGYSASNASTNFGARLYAR